MTAQERLDECQSQAHAIPVNDSDMDSDEGGSDEDGEPPAIPVNEENVESEDSSDEDDEPLSPANDVRLSRTVRFADSVDVLKYGSDSEDDEPQVRDTKFFTLKYLEEDLNPKSKCYEM